VLTQAPACFALAGLSMGGYVALEILRQAPQRVMKLALFDTSARADTPEQQERRRLLLALSRSGQFKGVTPRLLPLLIHPDRLQDKDLTTNVMAMAERVGRAAFANQQTAILNRIDSRPFLKNITCPTLVVGGKQDAITPPEIVREIADGVAGAHFEMIEECGHLSPLEQPQIVNDLMRLWLKG
jgi:pimeloyl-ACP methyl ester carboxylesterase